MTRLLVLLTLIGTPAWRRVLSSDSIIVDAREVPGSVYAELRATTEVDASVEPLCAAAFGTGLFDPQEPSLKSRSVISETEDERVAYDRIATPVIADRDYAVRTRRERGETGSCRVTVDIANEFAPPVSPGLVRVEKLHCTWEFVPQPNGHTTLTYLVWTDPNTSLPAFLVEPSRQRLMLVWVKFIIARARAASSTR